jgi:hypothetical protein
VCAARGLREIPTQHEDIRRAADFARLPPDAKRSKAFNRRWTQMNRSVSVTTGHCHGRAGGRTGVFALGHRRIFDRRKPFMC